MTSNQHSPACLLAHSSVCLLILWFLFFCTFRDAAFGSLCIEIKNRLIWMDLKSNVLKTYRQTMPRKQRAEERQRANNGWKRDTIKTNVYGVLFSAVLVLRCFVLFYVSGVCVNVTVLVVKKLLGFRNLSYTTHSSIDSYIRLSIHTVSSFSFLFNFKWSSKIMTVPLEMWDGSYKTFKTCLKTTTTTTNYFSFRSLFREGS